MEQHERVTFESRSKLRFQKTQSDCLLQMFDSKLKGKLDKDIHENIIHISIISVVNMVFKHLIGCLTCKSEAIIYVQPAFSQHGCNGF